MLEKLPSAPFTGAVLQEAISGHHKVATAVNEAVEKFISKDIPGFDAALDRLHIIMEIETEVVVHRDVLEAVVRQRAVEREEGKKN